MPLKLKLVYIQMLFLLTAGSIAQPRCLPLAEEVSNITIDSRNDRDTTYFSVDELLTSLPFLRQVKPGNYFAFGKLWSWQHGTIHLKNGHGIKWRAFAKNIILLETSNGPVFYSNINSQTIGLHGKITRMVNTSQGIKEVVIRFDGVNGN